MSINIIYHLERKRRKTIAIKVKADNSVLVSAPKWVSKKEIDFFVQQKKEWIEQQKAQNRELFAFYPGQQLLYMGKYYPVQVVANREEAMRHTVLWYRQRAKELLEVKVAYWASKVGVTYHSIKVNKAKCRWGSCSAKQNLNFPWRILFLPEILIDYVIVHELCHILQLNHSKLFWQEVERVLPDYWQRRSQLRAWQNEIRAYMEMD